MELICSCRHCSMALHSLLRVMHIIAVTWHGKYGLRAVPIQFCTAMHIIPQSSTSKTTLKLLFIIYSRNNPTSSAARGNSQVKSQLTEWSTTSQTPWEVLSSWRRRDVSVFSSLFSQVTKKIGKKLPFDWCNCHVLHHIAGLIRLLCCLVLVSVKGNIRSTVFSSSCGNLED